MDSLGQSNIDNVSEQRNFLPSEVSSGNMQLQGEVKINAYKPLQFNRLAAYILLPFLTIISCGIVLLVVAKNDRYRSKLIYKKCTIEEASHVLINGNDETYQIVKVEEQNPTIIIYRKVKYQAVGLVFIVVAFNLAQWSGFQDQKPTSGLSESQYQQRLRIYGKCEHRVDIPSIWEYLGKQLAGIFFILQYIVCIIYVIEKFYSFAAVMFGFSLITTIINYFLRRNSLQRIKEIAERTDMVDVIRGGRVMSIDSTDLVPGDIYVTKKGREGLPCDSIIVRGELYLNEASLTGENVPVGKTPPVNFSDTLKHNCWLHEGSEILETRGEPLALVVYTGFLTRKGRIIRKIIHKTEATPQFFKYGFYLLMELLVYCMIIFFVMIPTMVKIQITQTMFILRFFDMLGWVIPPAFPIFFNFCYSLSLFRLRQLKIYGTEPLKTIVSGKVKTMCFDKTGTLTENRMELATIIRFDSGVPRTYLAQNITQNDENDIGSKLFASCHTVRRIDGQFMGDQLDLRMFLFSAFEYQLSNQLGVKLVLKKNSVTLEVLRINQFESKFQSMSVLVKDVRLGNYYIFVKGAPEKIRDLSVNKYKQFDSTVSNLSLNGLRSLAFGYKEVRDPTSFINSPRDEFERDIKLIGIVGFQNKLKFDTRQTLILLKLAKIEVKIITGDNIYIGIQTAIRAGIIDSESKVLVFQGSMQSLDQNNKFYTGELLQCSNGSTKSSPITISKEQYESQPNPIVIDNKFFALGVSLPDTIKVFARISPQNKAEVIVRLKQQKVDQWKSQSRLRQCFSPAAQKIGMAGDGANDILAIKQADLGIGISETDSSFAAHFTICNVKDVQAIIRQGRSTLMIIIQIFRYYLVISILKFIVVTIMSIDKSTYSDNQFTYLNYAQTLQIVLLYCLSHPAETLSPWIPNDNFMSLQNHLIVFGQILIATAGMSISYYFATISGYFVFNPDHKYEQWQFICHTNSVLFLTSQLFYIFCSIWIYTGAPWKQRIFKNPYLTVWLILVIAINTAFFWITPNLEPFFGVLNIDNMVVKLFGVTIGFVLLGGIWVEGVRLTKLHQS